MPSVLDQALPFADSISGRRRRTPRYFSVFLTGTAVTTPTPGGERSKDFPLHCFSKGSPGFADGEGKNADAIGIGPVHRAWTVVDGAAPQARRRISAISATPLPPLLA